MPTVLLLHESPAASSHRFRRLWVAHPAEQETNLPSEVSRHGRRLRPNREVPVEFGKPRRQPSCHIRETARLGAYGHNPRGQRL